MHSECTTLLYDFQDSNNSKPNIAEAVTFGDTAMKRSRTSEKENSREDWENKGEFLRFSECSPTIRPCKIECLRTSTPLPFADLDFFEYFWLKLKAHAGGEEVCFEPLVSFWENLRSAKYDGTTLRLAGGTSFLAQPAYGDKLYVRQEYKELSKLIDTLHMTNTCVAIIGSPGNADLL